MTENEIREKIIEIIRECLPDFEDREIFGDTKINMEEGVDSMTFTYVMCRIEAVFDIKIPAGQWKKMLTLDDVVTQVKKKVR